MVDFNEIEVSAADYKPSQPGQKWKGICRFNLRATPGDFVLFDWGKLPVPNQGDIVTVQANYNEERRNYAVDKLTVIQPAQQATPSGSAGKSASKGEYRSPEDFKRTSALAQAVTLVTSIQPSEPTVDHFIKMVLHVAKHFNYFLSTGGVHKSLTPNTNKQGEQTDE